MDTCILMPRELSLILLPHPDPAKIFEMGMTLWANVPLWPGRIFNSEEGDVRLDKLELYQLLPERDIRYKFGCTDEILQVENREVRHCNWVRFLRDVRNPEDINIIAYRVHGQYLFQIIKTIPPNGELRAYFDLGPSLTTEEQILRDMTIRGGDKENLLISPVPSSIRSGDKEHLLISPVPSSIRGGDKEHLMISPVPSSIRGGDKEHLTISPVPSSIRGGDKEHLLISPIPSSIGSHSTDASPHSDDFEDDRSTTLSSDVSRSSTARLKPKESSSDFLSTPSSRGQKSTDDFSSTFASTPDDKQQCSPSSLVGSPPAYGMSFMSSLPDYGDARPLPLRRKEKTWLPCEVCGKKFDRPSLLKRHMRTHTGEKPHACDVCGKAFSTSSSLNTHRRIHSGEKPHECQVCGKRFTASSNLYYHRMTHKKEKPHKCSMCSKSFPTPGDLKSHMYVHNGSWPFKCDVCNRGFSKQTNLKNHMLLHTGDKPHECQLCGKKFALQCNLRTHHKTHEDESQEECARCKRQFLAPRTPVPGTPRGLCQDCTSSVTQDNKRSASNSRHSFSIESLVSPDSDARAKARHAQLAHVQTTPIDMSKAPFYASAMLSAGLMPMHPFATGASPFGLGVRWPPPPSLNHRFGP